MKRRGGNDCVERDDASKRARLSDPVIVIDSPPARKSVDARNRGNARYSSSSSSVKRTVVGGGGVGAVMPDVVGFFLNGIPGVEDQHSSVLIDQIVSGSIQEAYLFNYKVDLEFVMNACPVLKGVPVHVVHGERQQMAAVLNEMKLRYPNVQLYAAKLPIAYGTHHTKVS